MYWKSCKKEDCMYFLSGEAEMEFRNKSPKYALWIRFDQHEHIGQVTTGGTRWATYPCQFCEHYTPTKFDLYKEKKK